MTIRSQARRRILCFSVVATLAVFSMLLSAETRASTYYLSPAGSDSDSGNSSASPWKTFQFAIPKLFPGDTLVLANGTYNGSTSGYPDIRCGTNAKNGTAAQPIIVKAENERQAFLQGTGHQFPLYIYNCAYWKFKGLRVESADAANGYSQAMPVYAVNSQHLTLRRLLVRFNNRYQNSAGISLQQTNHSLLEENELYSYHRNGISIAGNYNTVRRNYVNSRNHRDLSGGRRSGDGSKGDSGIVIYPGSNNVMENNVVENVSNAYDMQAINTSINNKYFGNISLNSDYGALFVARGSSVGQMPRDTYLENHVALNAGSVGFYLRGTDNTQCINCTSLGSELAGFAADKGVQAIGSNSRTVFFKNTLAASNTQFGFATIEQSNFGINHCNAFGQTYDFWPNTDSRYTNISRLPSGLGSCKVFIPEVSPMKRAGANGADIGANVLYRYQNGALTSTPLWNVDTGAFTCGARIAGVNDIAGSSCFDVHKRLNVHTNSCFLPVGYGTGTATATAPVQTDESTPGIINPPLGSTITTSAVTFQWTPSSGGDWFWLAVGTRQGGGELLSYSLIGKDTFARTVSGLPTNGSPVWVRLYWWGESTSFLTKSADYQFSTN